MSALWDLSMPAWHFVLRGAIVYLSVLFLLRLGGKRQVGQMGAGDFAALLLLSNAVQNSMNGGDNSITGGLILAAVIVALSVFLSWATFKSARLERLLEGSPRLLIHHGRLIPTALEAERMSPRELHSLLRRQGVHSIEELEQAVLEADGSLSLIRKGEHPLAATS